jgi:hypothetical protein
LVPNQADFDLLSDIHRQLALSSLTWPWHWIRGPQDKHKLLRFLDFGARNNVYRDKLTKAFMAEDIAQHMNFVNGQFAEEGKLVSYCQEKLS